MSRKLVRDVKASKWQFAAIVLLVVIGMIFFVGLYSSFQNLWKSIDGPYETLNFADFTIQVNNAPSGVVEEIRSIEGVKAAEGRINQEAPMSMASMENQFLTARIITLPRDRLPAVNDVRVMEGAYFSSNSENQTLVEKFFADYHAARACVAVSAGPNNRVRVCNIWRKVNAR